jgi:hypothetical protein
MAPVTHVAANTLLQMRQEFLYPILPVRAVFKFDTYLENRF